MAKDFDDEDDFNDDDFDDCGDDDYDDYEEDELNEFQAEYGFDERKPDPSRGLSEDTKLLLVIFCVIVGLTIFAVSCPHQGPIFPEDVGEWEKWPI